MVGGEVYKVLFAGPVRRVGPVNSLSWVDVDLLNERLGTSMRRKVAARFDQPLD